MKTYKSIDSPVGNLYIVTTNSHLVGLVPKRSWGNLKKRFGSVEEGSNDIIIETQNQLDSYFKGLLKEFNLPILLEGTPFQKKAWNALLDIPYGETICYMQQAKNIKNPKAIRAIGGANGANPISIIVPCHRVIGKSGKLTGYASGLEIKKYLLKLESQ